MENLHTQHTSHIPATTAAQATIAKTWVEIDRRALVHNIEQYKNIVSPALFAPVIKSNAYGHGMELIAKLCQDHPAVDRLCTVSLREAVALRNCGITKPIVVLSIIDDVLELAALHTITLTVYDMPTAHALNEIGKKYNKKITIHIKVDTGLSRLGMLVPETLLMIKQLATLPWITIEGLFTHLANSESADASFVQYQLGQFQQLVEQLAAVGITIPLLHTSCSAAITAHKKTHYTMARAGIGVYGLSPSHENSLLSVQAYPTFALKPVLTWKTTIIQVKDIPAGSYIGYDLTYRASTSMRIATLPVGYWDGYGRHLSNNSHVIIYGQQAPVVGRIAMNLMMVDISAITGCAVGDEVILLGNHPGITADDLAARCNTINYEFVTRINPLLPRIVV